MSINESQNTLDVVAEKRNISDVVTDENGVKKIKTDTRLDKELEELRKDDKFTDFQAACAETAKSISERLQDTTEVVSPFFLPMSEFKRNMKLQRMKMLNSSITTVEEFFTFVTGSDNLITTDKEAVYMIDDYNLFTKNEDGKMVKCPSKRIAMFGDGSLVDCTKDNRNTFKLLKMKPDNSNVASGIETLISIAIPRSGLITWYKLEVSDTTPKKYKYVKTSMTVKEIDGLLSDIIVIGEYGGKSSFNQREYIKIFSPIIIPELPQVDD